MQFLSFRNGGRNGLATRENGASFFGLLEGDPNYPGPLDGLVARSASDRHAAGQPLLAGAEIDPASVEVLPPLASPGKIICVGSNYRAMPSKAAAPGVPPNPYADYRWKGLAVNLPPPANTVDLQLGGYRQMLADKYGIGYFGCSATTFFDNALNHAQRLRGAQVYAGQEPTVLSQNFLALTLISAAPAFRMARSSPSAATRPPVGTRSGRTRSTSGR